MARSLFILAVGLWLSAAARAEFLLPYSMTLGAEERYSVFVILPDYYLRDFGDDSGLSALLASSYLPNSKKLLLDYIQIPQLWYGTQIEREPRIYGVHREQIARDLGTFESMGDGNGAIIVVTRYGLPDQPVALFRVEPQAPGLLLPSNRHFLDKGLDGREFPVNPAALVTDSFPQHAFATGLDHVLNLQFPLGVVKKLWRRHGNAEAKNYAITPELRRRLFPYIFSIAWYHRMFSYSAHTYPDIPTRGTLLDTIWLDCYGDLLAGFYEDLGYKTWGEKINNDHTYGLDLRFMYASVEAMLRGNLSTIANHYGEAFRMESWLRFDHDLARGTIGLGCAQDLVEAAAPKSRRR